MKTTIIAMCFTSFIALFVVIGAQYQSVNVLQIYIVCCKITEISQLPFKVNNISHIDHRAYLHSPTLIGKHKLSWLMSKKNYSLVSKQNP